MKICRTLILSSLHILACTFILTTTAEAEGPFWSIVGPEGIVSEQEDTKNTYTRREEHGGVVIQRIGSRVAIATASGKNNVDIVMVGLKNPRAWGEIFDAELEFEKTGDEKLIEKMKNLAVGGGAEYIAIAFSKEEDQLVGAIATNDAGYRKSVRQAYKIAAKKFKEASPRERHDVLNILLLQVVQMRMEM